MDDKIAKVMGFANFGKKGDGAKKRGGDSFSKGMMGVIGKKATKGADAKLSKEIERRVEVAEEMDKQAVKNAHLTEEALGSETGAALPVTHTAVLRARDKAVTALAIDGTGSRLIMGGMDFKVSMFHFAGMDSRLLPFKEHEPHEGYPVNDLSYSPSSDRCVHASLPSE
ncbi:Gastrulation defective protein 1-like protein [Diplonema papillatum]|nr:Gastrulation defective protein 1-like protein [Diplonema papillatum]